MARRALEPRTVARVVAAFGFEALRGRSGTGSGAAPAHRLAELRIEGIDDDKRTVARKAAQGIPAGAPPASTATPFDFAFATLFDWSRNGGQASFEAALDIMGESVVPLDPEGIREAIASLMRLTVEVEFEDPEARFLTGAAVESLALDYVAQCEFRRHASPGGGEREVDESLAWASWLLERRRQESRQTTAGYEAVLNFALLRLRRRPKPGYTTGRIVRAVQSLWAGSVHRAFLLPEEYAEYRRGVPPAQISPTTGLPEGDGQIEQAMVDLVMGMTEDSLFSTNQTSLDTQLVVAGLRRYRTARTTVPLGPVVAETGADGALMRKRFPTDREFASACLQWLAGEWQGFEPFALQFRASAMAGVEALLTWVDSVHRDFPVLLGAAGFVRGDPAFDEVVTFTAQVLSDATLGRSGAVRPDDSRRARRCVEAAANGDDWRAIAGTPRRRRPEAGG
jgi:hypothetical protein